MRPRMLLGAQCGQGSGSTGFDRLTAGECTFQNSAVCSAALSSFAGVSCRKSYDCHMTLLTGHCPCDHRF